MSEETVINCCSPCLAGLKTGNLFSSKVDDKNELLRSIRELNRRLVPRGLRIMPVKITKIKGTDISLQTRQARKKTLPTKPLQSCCRRGLTPWAVPKDVWRSS